MALTGPSSSSSSSAVDSIRNNIFLSFRGEDTHNFTTQLRDALRKKRQIKTYTDDTPNRGDEISPSFLKAVEESSAAIIVFSRNYASSKWCLEELAKIIECNKEEGLPVVPVYYGVEPEDVWEQRGSYKEAFAKLERITKDNQHDLTKWKRALSQVAGIAGWDSRNYKDDSELIQNIVEDVRRKLEVNENSSSAATFQHKMHDVFISFKGEDTRRNFICHLRNALHKEGIKTYVDDKINRGDEISPTLLQAIEESYISIIIFSVKYAFSKWCLNELVKILECKKKNGHIIIPVFYEVDPSNVRKQSGSYKEALDQHKLSKEKDALSEVANLTGWDSQMCGRCCFRVCGMGSQSFSSLSHHNGLSTLRPCKCGEVPVMSTSWSVDNPGRRYYHCPFVITRKQNACDYFDWFDPHDAKYLTREELEKVQTNVDLLQLNLKEGLGMVQVTLAESKKREDKIMNFMLGMLLSFIIALFAVLLLKL